MAANYDNSAWFYDRLSHMVYGRALVNAQLYLLQFVKAGQRVLIAGGGTGWILEELCKLYPSGLEIVYVEISANMIALSRKRDVRNNQVDFINAPVEEVKFDKLFDTIITPFLFDNFTQANAQAIFNHVGSLLKLDGTWLNCDFRLTGKWWQRFLLKSMLVFFRMICHIEAKALPDIDGLFKKGGYEVVEERSFFGEFVIARLYKLAAGTADSSVLA